MSGIGTNPSAPVTEKARLFGLLDRAYDRGRCLVYVQASAAITAGDAVLIGSDGSAASLDTTNSANAGGKKVGVAVATFASGEYGFVVVNGVATLNVATSAAAGARLNTTGTGGTLDNDGGVGAEVVEGIGITTAESGGTATAVLSEPYVGATL